MGAGGVIPPPATYFEKVFSHCFGFEFHLSRWMQGLFGMKKHSLFPFFKFLQNIALFSPYFLFSRISVKW
jgi:hypothetical protein